MALLKNIKKKELPFSSYIEYMDSIKIILCGDSTMASYPINIENQAGWGQVLHQYFKKNVEVYNFAAGGRSSRSFYNELERWARVKEMIRASSVPVYVFIQFGHNDQKLSTAPQGLERMTFAMVNPDGSECGTYFDYICRFIFESRELGAIPILFTPFVRADFIKDKVSNKGRHNLTEVYPGEVIPRGNYVEAMKEAGKRYNVPVIDITELSANFVENYYKKGEIKKLYISQDNTHEKELGANLIARNVISGFKNLDILREYISLL